MRKREYRYLMCDFETTVYKGQEYTEVWAAASVEFLTEEVTINHSMQEFFNHLKSYKANLICYFHNLKFDGNFIIDYLLRNGWVFNRIAEGKMLNNQFKCAISNRGAWYTITIKLAGFIIEFRDSLKLLPFSVKRIGKSFKTKHQKLEMEYEGVRWAGCPITQEERQYISNDVLVVKEALELMFSQGHQKLTIGSCCMEEFKRGYDKTDFSNFFPDLTKLPLDVEEYGSTNVDQYIRKSYRGGWCYLKRGCENKVYKGGYTADINSSYPSNMSSESGNYYPVGLPEFWKGEIPKEAKDKFYFVRFRCRFKLKSKKLPTVQIKNSFLYSGTEYLETSDVYDYQTGTYKRYVMRDGKKQDTRLTMTMTMMDYELFLKHYAVYDLEELDGCYFYKEIGLFDDYMYRYKEIKENSKDAERELAKLYLNNLYGKFSASDDSSYKVPYLNNKGIIALEIIEEHSKKPGYIAIGSAITSYARRFVIEHAQANYDNFIYADTDSIHCFGNPYEVKMVKVHPTKFCHWKLESYWDRAIFVRQKTYIEHVTHNDGEPIEPYYSIRCAGMSDQAKEEFINNFALEDFKEGLVLSKGLKPHRMVGGIVLKEDGYKMNKKKLKKVVV